MKENILFLILAFMSIQVKAQNICQQLSFNINGATYKVSYRDGNNYEESTAFIIKNQSNVLHGIADQYSINTEDCFYEYLFGGAGILFIKTKIQSQFTPVRVAELKSNSETGFVLSFFLDKNGVLKEMYFSIGKNTKLTPQEIYNMEMSLKNVQIPFTMKNCPTTGTGYFSYSINVGFGNN